MRGPYLVLLPVGFALPVLLPVPWWALTPPFRPCLIRPRVNLGAIGGLFSVALIRQVALPGR